MCVCAFTVTDGIDRVNMQPVHKAMIATSAVIRSIMRHIDEEKAQHTIQWSRVGDDGLMEREAWPIP
jgi:hypothetical protein